MPHLYVEMLLILSRNSRQIWYHPLQTTRPCKARELKDFHICALHFCWKADKTHQILSLSWIKQSMNALILLSNLRFAKSPLHYKGNILSVISTSHYRLDKNLCLDFRKQQLNKWYLFLGKFSNLCIIKCWTGIL